MDTNNAPQFGSIEYYDAIPGFWDTADAIERWLEARPGKLYNRSTIARGVKVDLVMAERVLAYLDQQGYVRAAGNGAWRKFTAR